MKPTSRIQRLTQILGGKENLPSKLSTEPSFSGSDVKEESQPEVAESNPLQDNRWWTKLPVVVQAPRIVTSEPSTSPLQDDRWWTKLPVVHQASKDISSDSSTTPLTAKSPASTTETHRDTPAAFGVDYCPFIAVTKFCYKFVSRRWMQPLATAFFDSGKIFERNWDTYYIWSEHFVTPKPVVFVPEQQVLDLLEAINIGFPEANVSISEDLRREGFVINFDEFDYPDLRPRYLGLCISKTQFETLVDEIKMPRSSRQLEQPGERTLGAFKSKMELANEIAKNKNKVQKERRHAEQLVKRERMAEELLTTQRYLGLAPGPAPSRGTHEPLHDERNSPSSREGLPTITTEQSLSSTSKLLSNLPVDPEKAPPYPTWLDVIFIAVDVEAYERSPKLITEVGIATLDTRDLKDVPPGEIGKNWQKFINSRHLRIDEHKNLVNSEFVRGCPDRFEFGDSEFIREKALLKTLTACFNPPYSKPGEKWTDEKRHLVLVGHDVGQDIQYLQNVGFNVFNRNNLKESLDTASMFRVYTHDPNARSLGSLLYEFDLVGFNLHNAGNDATYTMWVMLAIAVKTSSERGSPTVAEKHVETLRKRTEAAQEQATQRVQDDAAGWELKS